MNSANISEPAKNLAHALSWKRRPFLAKLMVVVVVVLFSGFYLWQPGSRDILHHVYFIPVGISGFLFGWSRASGLALFGFCLAFCVGFANFSETNAQEYLQIIVWGCALGATGGFLGILATRYNQQVKMELQKQAANALTDPLTSVANRRAFNFELDRRLNEFQRNRSDLVIAIIDIDHFKNFNDKYGHDVGDEVLKSIAKLIGDCLRNADLVARFGGEEFVVILPGTAQENAKVVAERIRANIEKHNLNVGGLRLRIQVSIGGTVARRTDDSSELIRRADQALFAAKQMGRNRVIFSDDQPEEAETTQNLVTTNFGQLHQSAHCNADFRDPVTQQSSLKVFNEELRRRANEANRYQQALSFCLIDLINYSEFNSRGDECCAFILSFVAERIKDIIRDSDVVCWYSPDQFAIMCPNTKSREARVAVERILRTFENGRHPVFRGIETKVELQARTAELERGESSYDLIVRTEELTPFQVAHLPPPETGEPTITVVLPEVIDDSTTTNL